MITVFGNSRLDWVILAQGPSLNESSSKKSAFRKMDPSTVVLTSAEDVVTSRSAPAEKAISVISSSSASADAFSSVIVTVSSEEISGPCSLDSFLHDEKKAIESNRHPRDATESFMAIRLGF